ncbi:hypothetical protein OG2516_16019 [Oceanicola granulosus HTCC2516]|uniref:Uncharacterized protein n=1 Tax=Oceanicola granulosus (strain ATCC BAA-861 / DSM 15982 / KCTC 12143 / HTCC2516) TaxID=314256 RepID=Q2CGW2_OCEGH|nr:hypothetical protein [Oceanicola granulosus]EAR51823.1 hypothetical protein OG2516_16019 [Oceanicola granulosus HTCC2516]
MDGDLVSARGIDHFASERWDVRWFENIHFRKRTLLPGGWSAAVEAMVDADSGMGGRYYRHPPCEPRQLLLPFWGGENGRAAETMGHAARTPEGNRLILNTMSVMTAGGMFDALDCDDLFFDMRQSVDDPDLLLFGLVGRV